MSPLRATRSVGRRAGRSRSAVLAVLLTIGLCGAVVGAGLMKQFPSGHYLIISDLPEEDIREAQIRMATLFEEYRGRSKGFRGSIRSRMIFRIYSDRGQYIQGGGPPGSAGYFNPRTSDLAALADDDTRYLLWHIVQHEAFHQFAYFVISKNLPVWANEGMADYFGRAIWVGDDYITGVITPFDRLNIVTLIENKQMISFQMMMAAARRDWNTRGSYRDYLQVWSMVHFFAHADDGKYLAAFDKFLVDLDRGRPWEASFKKRFRVDVKVLQAEYEKWWLAQPECPERKDIEAVVATLTAYLARAHIKRQTFDSAEAFFAAARAGDLQHPKEQWLPPTLLAEALAPSTLFETQLAVLPEMKELPYGRERSKKMHEFKTNEDGEDRSVPVESLGTWSIEHKVGRPLLVLTREDGTVFTGSFTVSGLDVRDVDVEIVKPPSE